MCGLSALPWRPNSTVASRSWRRRRHSSPERPWSCSLRTPRRRRRHTFNNALFWYVNHISRLVCQVGSCWRLTPCQPTTIKAYNTILKTWARFHFHPIHPLKPERARPMIQITWNQRKEKSFHLTHIPVWALLVGWCWCFTFRQITVSNACNKLWRSTFRKQFFYSARHTRRPLCPLALCAQSTTMNTAENNVWKIPAMWLWTLLKITFERYRRCDYEHCWK